MLFEFENTNAKSSNNKSTLANLDEGFLKGNMFTNLYEPYKNYAVQKLTPKTEKDLLLYNIYKLSFAINDLNLYLDINPDDQAMYNIFKNYVNAYNSCLDEYEKKYNIIELNNDDKNNYTWYKNPWPWEDTYV